MIRYVINLLSTYYGTMTQTHKKEH